MRLLPVDTLLRFALQSNLFLHGGGLAVWGQSPSQGQGVEPLVRGRKFLKINANLGTGINRENVLSRKASYRAQFFLSIFTLTGGLVTNELGLWPA